MSVIGDLDWKRMSIGYEELLYIVMFARLKI
jgi:hypothetical protein